MPYLVRIFLLVVALGVPVLLAAQQPDKPRPRKLLQRDSIPLVAPPDVRPDAPATIADDPETADSVTQIDIVYADQLVGKGENTNLYGSVELRQGAVYMFCDTAVLGSDNNVYAYGNIVIKQDTVDVFADRLYYNGDQKLARLEGDVILSDGNQQLYTDRLLYDLDTRTGYYTTGGLLASPTSQLSSKRGYYYASTDDVFFKDSVVVVDDQFTLRADTLRFNTETKTAFFLGPTIISQEDGRIYTERGYYDTDDKYAEFYDRPQYVTGERRATADRMTYDGNLRLTTLIGDARFRERDRRATADTLQYDEANDITYLIGSPFYQDDSQTLTAEQRIVYDAKTDSYTTVGRTEGLTKDGQLVKAENSYYDAATGMSVLIGDVLLADSTQIVTADTARINVDTGIGFLRGNVDYRDTTNDLSIRTQNADLDRSRDYLLAYERPLMMTILSGDTLWLVADTLLSERRPVLSTVAEGSVRTQGLTSVMSKDSTSMSDSTQTLIDSLPKSPVPTIRDTATLITPDSTLLDSVPIDSISLVSPAVPDSIDVLIAYGDVRLYKSDLQIVCDSMVYNRTDSVFSFYQNPVLWTDSTQMSADTMLVLLRNDEIDRVELRQSAFIITTPDEIFYNQVSGKQIIAYLDSNRIQTTRVLGNGEAIYYALDEADAYIGVNKSICSEMLLRFEANQVQSVTFYTQPQGAVYPMKKVNHQALRLKGFDWQVARRPLSVFDLGSIFAQRPEPPEPPAKTPRPAPRLPQEK